ncbi:MAG TPA: hypothetical protein VE758_05440 [Chthoniobacterales bacterium]|jgi:hypothetical protein|nr:hypothetical protein [Chthoniobacterales bacterium]
MKTSLAKLRKTVCAALFVASIAAFVSCASENQPTRLVDDPDAKQYDSAIPWNRQERWEQGTAISDMVQQGIQGSGSHY